MPTSTLKRPSGGGGGSRLRRLLASLRPPTRAGPLPVQTGFPTSLADIVVKNHSRLRNSSRRHRGPSAATVPPPAAVADAETQQRRELSLSADHDASAVAAGGPVPPTGPGKGAAGGFSISIRPGILAAGGAVALALLVVIWWSKQLVAVATLASVALSWIESVRSDDRWRSETDLRRGLVDSPVLDRETAVESPRRSCGECGSDDGASDADSGDLVCDGSSSAMVNNPKLKQSRRRSLRKLLADKLRNGKTTPRGGTDSRWHGEPERRPETPRRVNAEPTAAAAADAPAEETTPTTPRPPKAITDDDDDRSDRRRCGRALPLPALIVPIILAGLVAGKLPALALAVLCAAFSSSSVERVPAAGKASR